jgi:hypothetical protein
MAKKGTKTQKGGQVEDQQQIVTEAVVAEVEPTVVDATVDATVEQVVDTGAEQKGGSKKRTFKIKLADTEFCSRITGSTPKQAASKALTLLINQKKKAGKPIKGKQVFTIKETTRGSKGKEYSYQGEKVKLKTPTTYSIKSSNGEVKTIVNKFKNVIEKHQINA